MTTGSLFTARHDLTGSGYRYFTTDLLTNRMLADPLPLEVESMTRYLGDVGELSGSLLLGDPTVRQLDPMVATAPKRTALWVERNGVLVWGGIIWDRPHTSVADGRLPITAKTFESYLFRRQIWHTLSTSSKDAAVLIGPDQTRMAADLVNYVQSDPRGNIGIQVPPPALSGVTRAVTWWNYEGRVAGEALRDLAGLADGFDWTIEVSYDPLSGTPQKALRIGYPRLGRALLNPSDPDLPTFEYPGNIVDYGWPEAGSESANRSRATGTGQDEQTDIRTSTFTDELAEGYPLLDQTVSYTDETDLTRLQAAADGDVKEAAGLQITPTLRVAPTSDPQLGSFGLGDDVRVRLTSPRHPAGPNGEPGFDGPVRHVGWRLTPPTRTSLESLELLLEEL